MSIIPAHRQADRDTLFLFNYRSDRMREISTVLGRLDKPVDVDIPKNLVRSVRTACFCDNLRSQQHITTMSRYNAEFPFPNAYPPQAMTNVLAEWLSKHGIKQAHIAGLSHASAFPSSCLMSSLYVHTETEKYAHVTFFFNGGVENQFEEEERHMVDSPKVATYDKLPQMSVQGVADKVAEVVRAGKHEFVMCNFAPPDMVSTSCLGRSVFSLLPQRIALTQRTTHSARPRLAIQAFSRLLSKQSHTLTQQLARSTKRAKRRVSPSS
jgi:2,3-bisphosphoglycerate-independent phosphoglycerate mutase